MAEADTEDRFLADQLLHVLLRVWHCVGIARTVGEEDAVRIHRQHVVRRRRSRNDCDPAACLGEIAQNVVLDAVIISDDKIYRRAEGSLAFAISSSALLLKVEMMPSCDP